MKGYLGFRNISCLTYPWFDGERIFVIMCWLAVNCFRIWVLILCFMGVFLCCLAKK